MSSTGVTAAVAPVGGQCSLRHWSRSQPANARTHKQHGVRHDPRRCDAPVAVAAAPGLPRCDAAVGPPAPPEPGVRCPWESAAAQSSSPTGITDPPVGIRPPPPWLESSCRDPSAAGRYPGLLGHARLLLGAGFVGAHADGRDWGGAG